MLQEEVQYDDGLLIVLLSPCRDVRGWVRWVVSCGVDTLLMPRTKGTRFCLFLGEHSGMNAIYLTYGLTYGLTCCYLPSHCEPFKRHVAVALATPCSVLLGPACLRLR